MSDKTKITGARLQEVYALLDMDVTNDLARLKKRYFEYSRKMADKQTRGSHTEKALWNDFEQMATCYFKNESTVQEMINDFFSKARIVVDQLLMRSEGSKLTPEVFEELVQVIVKDFQFDPDLASQRLKTYLETERTPPLHVGMDDVIVFHEVGKAQLVKALRFAPLVEGPKLTWKLPDKECDAVVLVRKNDGPPKSAKDGIELAQGKLDEWLDRSAQEGETYHYAVFSVLNKKASPTAKTIIAYRSPKPVSDHKVFLEKGTVTLQWKPPADCRRVHVYRAPRQHNEFIVDASRLILPSDCDEIPNIGSSTEDRSAKSEIRYFYHFINETKSGQYSAPATVSFVKPVPLPLPLPKSFVSFPERVQVSWDHPRKGDCSYQVFRRPAGERNVPANAKPLYDGPDTEFTDTEATAGESYSYFVTAILGDQSAGPVHLGETTAIAEVHRLRAESGENVLRLSWEPPPGVVRCMIRRAVGITPPGKTDGTLLPCDDTSRFEDDGVKLNRDYSYRVCCVFRDVRGREIVTEGVTSPPCRAYNLPKRIERVRPVIHDDHLRIPLPSEARDELLVFRRKSLFPMATDSPARDGVVSLQELRRESKRVPWKKKGAVSDDVQSDWPCYAIVSQIDVDRAMVQWQIMAVAMDVKVSRRSGDAVVTWRWPEGVDRVRVECHIAPEKVDGPVFTKHIVTRGPVARRGEFLDPLKEEADKECREYRIVPLANKDRRIIFVPHGPHMSLLQIDPIPAELRYEVEHRFSPSWGRWLIHVPWFKRWVKQKYFLKLRLNKPLDSLPALKLLRLDSPDDFDGEEDNVLNTYNEEAGPFPAGTYERTISWDRSKTNSPQFVRLVLLDGDNNNVLLFHPTAWGQRQL